MGFFSTFRGRLLLILLFLLVATLGVQYYVNLRTQQENEQLRELQTRALVAGIAVGFNSLTSKEDRVGDLIDRPGQTFLDEDTKARIRDIIIIDNNWNVIDSLNEQYIPTVGDNDELIYKNLSDIHDLPPLVEGKRLGEDVRHFPNAPATEKNVQDDEAHAVPLETSKGRWYVMVLLRNDRGEAARRAAQPLIFTLGILLISTLITFFLVWRFTRPIANLSDAARHVAAGDLGVRVPGEQRNDEMGQLAQRFNEMTSQLEKKLELEAALQQAEKSAVVGRLGSAIAHEIRNPLNYINLTLDHLRTKFEPEDAGKQENFRKLTSQLKAEVARINQQITDFLNYSRPANVNLQPIEIRKVIDDSLRIVEAEAEEKNIRIGLVEHENVGKVMGDPEFLRSVFNNLFINSMQAMEKSGGHLTVKILQSDDDRFVDVDVSDTGGGISEENLSKIFEPYFSTKETGTGLGLAIVQKIVDLHRGAILVESKQGEGTRFTVRLLKSERTVNS
jgi:signal transduction histidine kinase